MTRQPQTARGVSLIEALVALLIMSFGMLGIVGVQSSLRLSADVAKQRSEAVRLAQQGIEDWRSFTLIATTPGVLDYADLVTDVDTIDSLDGYTTNARYVITREVVASDFPAARLKELRVTVAWSDRTSDPSTPNQSVELNTVLSGVSPGLAGTLAVAGNVNASGESTRAPMARHRAIPVQAVTLPNGTSAFRPPQSSSGNVVFVFNNSTGLVTLCESAATNTSALLSTPITGCGSNVAQLLSGFVRFAYNVTPTAAVAEDPTGSALNLNMAISLTSTGNPDPYFACFDDAPTTAAAASLTTSVAYYCVVFSNPAGVWSGISTIEPLGLDGNPAWNIDSTGAGNYKVCRYTAANSDTPANRLHPRAYQGVTASDLLTNQNFLVIAANNLCPTDVLANPEAGDFVNSNTRLHQPAPPPPP